MLNQVWFGVCVSGVRVLKPMGVGSKDCRVLASPLTWGPPGTEGGAQLPGTSDSLQVQERPG